MGLVEISRVQSQLRPMWHRGLSDEGERSVEPLNPLKQLGSHADFYVEHIDEAPVAKADALRDLASADGIRVCERVKCVAHRVVMSQRPEEMGQQRFLEKMKPPD